MPNFMSVDLTVFELLAFDTQKSRGHVTLAMAFGTIFSSNARTVPETRVNFEVCNFNSYEAISI